MSKLMLLPEKKTLNYNCDAYLIGIKDLSVNLPIYYTLDEIKKIKTKKELFITINKNIHSSDIEHLKTTLKELEKLNIKGILFYDIGVLNIVKKMDLKLNLIIAQEHMNTNYETINYWYQEGITGTLIPSEISKNEIIEIKKNTKSQLIVPILGYFPMFISKRHLIENYKKRFNIKNKQKINYIEKENNIYPIIDEQVTTVYTKSYLNGTKEYNEFEDNNIDYLLINGFLIEEKKLNKIIEILNTVTKENKDEYNSEIEKILEGNTDTFFLNKQSIYKVK